MKGAVAALAKKKQPRLTLKDVQQITGEKMSGDAVLNKTVMTYRKGGDFVEKGAGVVFDVYGSNGICLKILLESGEIVNSRTDQVHVISDGDDETLKAKVRRMARKVGMADELASAASRASQYVPIKVTSSLSNITSSLVSSSLPSSSVPSSSLARASPASNPRSTRYCPAGTPLSSF